MKRETKKAIKNVVRKALKKVFRYEKASERERIIEKTKRFVERHNWRKTYTLRPIPKSFLLQDRCAGNNKMADFVRKNYSRNRLMRMRVGRCLND